jgi:hypothetical protein
MLRRNAVRGLGAARLVSTPSRRNLRRAWLGIAISGFPDFEQFCIAGFSASTQVFLSPLRMPFRHARVAARLQFPIIEQAAQIYTSDCGVEASRSF